MIIEKPKIEPSKYQKVIYDTIINTNKNIVVKATAGSGKTTTLVEISKIIPKEMEVVFTAFNKSIAEELSKRLPDTVLCSTLHSMGMRAVMSHFRTNLTVNEYKSFNFLKEILKDKVVDPEVKQRKPEEMTEYQFLIRSAVDLARMTLTKWKEKEIFELCNYYGLEILEHEVCDVIAVLKKYELYNRGLSKNHNWIDYVDMIYLPVAMPMIKLPKFDYVLLDESQDTNICQQNFIQMLKKPNGRLISVGDPSQAIYAFMGSSSSAFDNFANLPNTIQLPLSICYRCGTDIVKLAQTVYPDIEPFEQNEKGIIRQGSIKEAIAGDFVLCRNNRPLMYVYFQLLQEGKNPIVVGKDIQEGLEALVNKVINKNTDEGMEIIMERLTKLEDELKSKGIKNVKENPRYEALYDKVMTVDIIANRFDTMKEVKKEIVSMFEKKENCITLTTIHKAKGLEADRVFIIERFDGQRLLPSPYAITAWQKISEKNLRFVCYTRAKREIVFIPNIEST